MNFKLLSTVSVILLKKVRVLQKMANCSRVYLDNNALASSLLHKAIHSLVGVSIYLFSVDANGLLLFFILANSYRCYFKHIK